MYSILSLVSGIASITFAYLANSQKDQLDEIEKSKENDVRNAILKSTKINEFNSECNRFFEEFNSTRFAEFYKYGYIVVKQFENDSLCKKSFGQTHYTDLSTFKIYEENEKYYFFHHYRLAQNLFGMNGTIRMQKAEISSDDTLIDLNLLSRPQRIWGVSAQVNDLHLVNSVIIVENTKPYIYVFGLIDKRQTEQTLKKGVAARLQE